MFESYTDKFLLDRMLEKVDDKMDKREGSIIYDALAPAALELSNFYVALEMVMKEVFGDSASYYYLIKRAAERGVYPQQATNAVCKMSATPSSVTLNAGDRFNLDDLNYSVIGPVADETGKWKIECESDGECGNKETGDLIPIETIEGLETATITGVLIPGEEEEEEEDFRERYFNSFSSKSYGGNKLDYMEKVNSMQGVGGCKPIRAWNGYSPSSMIPDSAVTTWFDQQSSSTLGSGVYTWISNVYNAAMNHLLTTGGTVKIIIINSQFRKPSDTLIQSVQEELDPGYDGEGDGVAPVGHVVNVVGVEETTVNFTFTLTLDSGKTFDDVQSVIETVIESKLTELRQQWSASDGIIIRKSVIESSILSIDGVIDITETMINGSASNLALDIEHIPVLGVVSSGT
ncbi:baseplate J/gp47 family protein [[Clostridium] polysaccharolyticum]|uniref:Uncharacterized phage protein gp47/JayE n=1 Tax=[Clostridium] polysaccharolyticum TaxID=29364 RepID=A0A1H9YHJ7_9FIRM|nr:baseplate J/gp47 family protein [[Clostridium] polysaccharolyticum]SES68398.1 Uncharacterized phage protein gp47/JayE [[Clostridium] polysaccharolyticum]